VRRRQAEARRRTRPVGFPEDRLREYSEGILRDVIVALSAKKGLAGYQIVSG
jgi:hypothetical protein